jgi:hypothetical protein
MYLPFSTDNVSFFIHLIDIDLYLEKYDECNAINNWGSLANRKFETSAVRQFGSSSWAVQKFGSSAA